MLEEQLLDHRRHDRQAFTSGVRELDEYLQRFSVQQSKKGINVVRVLVDTDTPGTILGYYSLSAAQVDAIQVDECTQQKLPLCSPGDPISATKTDEIIRFPLIRLYQRVWNAFCRRARNVPQN